MRTAADLAHRHWLSLRLQEVQIGIFCQVGLGFFWLMCSETSTLTSRVGYGRALMWPLGGACRIGAEIREQAVVVISAS
jgi:hypothetical protein